MRTKTAGLTHHWTYLPQREGVHEDRLIHAEKSLTDARRMLVKDAAWQDFFAPLDQKDPRKTETHLFDRYLEIVGRTLSELADEELDAKTIGTTKKLIVGLEKAQSTLLRYNKSTHYRYKRDPEVEKRATINWYGLAWKSVEAVQKYVKLLEAIPTTSSSDYEIPMEVWEKIKKAATDVMVRTVKYAQIPLAGPEGSGKPIIDNEKIAFNGKKPNNFESFWLERAPGQELSESCKTGGPLGDRPYNLAVTNILAAAQRIAPKYLRVKFEGPVKPLPTSPVSGLSKGQVMSAEA